MNIEGHTILLGFLLKNFKTGQIQGTWSIGQIEVFSTLGIMGGGA